MSGDEDDIVWVERRQDVRIAVSIPGRFWLADRRDMQGERRVFPCRAVNLSSQAIALAAAVSAKLGDRVIAEIEHLGKLEGSNHKGAGTRLRYEYRRHGRGARQFSRKNRMTAASIVAW